MSNEKPCDCPTNMPAQQCIRYCTGECDGPDDTLASAALSHNNAKPDDGFAGTVSPVSSAVGPTWIDWDNEPPPPLDHYENSVPITTQLETVGERLKRLYPEHYVRIITEANRQNGPEHTATMLGNNAAEYLMALAAMFIWDRAPEGHEYWCELAQREQA